MSVPAVVGRDRQDAVAAVKNAGLVAAVFSVPASDPQGTVVAQDPGGELVDGLGLVALGLERTDDLEAVHAGPPYGLRVGSGDYSAAVVADRLVAGGKSRCGFMASTIATPTPRT